MEREHLTPRERRALHWHMANLEYGCAASLQRVSLAWWDQDDAQEMLGDHLVLKDGFNTLIDGLAAYSEVLTEREVTLVEHGDEGVRVHTRGGGESIVADAALVTVPLGVLKAKTMKFSPALPAWKRAAVERLGFGPIEKVVLLFERRFWEEDSDFFGCLMGEEVPNEKQRHKRGEFFLFWNLERSHGVPGLTCVSSGLFAEESWRALQYKTVVSKALDALCRTFGEEARKLFKRSVVSDWGRNPYTRGSYSYVAADSSGRDYDELAAPVGTRLFFAGEATNGQHPATATGAFLSGLREAQRIDEAVRAEFVPPARVELA